MLALSLYLVLHEPFPAPANFALFPFLAEASSCARFSGK